MRRLNLEATAQHRATGDGRRRQLAPAFGHHLAATIGLRGRLTKLLFWAMTRDVAHRVCIRGPQGLAERQPPGAGR